MMRRCMNFAMVLAMWVGGVQPLVTRGAEYAVFTEAPQQAVSRPDASGDLPEGFPAGNRWRAVTLSPVIADPDRLTIGDKLIFDLFDDAIHTAVVGSIRVNVLGTVTLRARIEDRHHAYVLITTTGGRTLGSVRIPEEGRHFVIQSEQHTGRHYLLDVKDDGPVDEAGCEAPVPPPPAPGEGLEVLPLADSSTDGPLDPAVIDVMVVYTPAARTWAETYGGGIANVVAQSMARAQLSHDNSQTLVTLNLVHSAEVDYVETNNGGVDLRRLTASPSFNPWGSTYDGYSIPGYMDEVHDWRDQYGADLVALFTQVSQYGGIAWLLNSTSGRPEYGFSVTRVQQAHTTSYTHAHEMGHNMGCHHHKEQNYQAGPGLFGYSAGWRWIGIDDYRFCSVMTYTGGQYFADGLNHARVAHFSDPNVLFQDVPTGHAADGDNARTIRETKHVIAGYRQIILVGACCMPDGSCAEQTSGDCAAVGGTYQGDSTSCVQLSCPQPFNTRDLDGDGDVDMADYGLFQVCLGPPWAPPAPGCEISDFDLDGSVDTSDFLLLKECLSGAGVPADTACME